MLNRDIGKRLRQARLNKQLTIDELQQMTKIQKRYLEAIESSNFDALPGTFYVRAFIRQFAEAVDEDGNELVDIFDGKAFPEQPKPKAPESIQVSRKEIHEEEEGPVKTFWSSLPMIILGLVALAIIVVVVFMMVQNNPSERVIEEPTDILKLTSSSSSESSESSSFSSTSETTVSTTETIESSEEKQTNISFDGETNGVITMTANDVVSPASLTFEGTNGTCWIGVQVDGSYIYQYTLTAGVKQSTEIPSGAGEVVITLGASNNATISLNDELLEFNPNSSSSVKKTINLALNYQ